MAVKLNEAQKAIIAKNDTIVKEPVLSVQDLVISFKTDNGKVQAVRGVNFDLHKGETLCIVGESGSGKSVTSKAIMGILSPNAIVENGHIIYEGEDLLSVSEEEFHRIRGHKIGMIFQDPLSSLNPIVKIGKQIIETMLINSNQLKNYEKDLYAPELTALKNSEVIRNIEIKHAEMDFDAATKDMDKKSPEYASLKAEKQNRIQKAKDAYKAGLPELKEKLKAAKLKAKEDTKAHAEDLLKERDEKLAKLAQDRASLKVSDADKARIAELEQQIAQLKKQYGIKISLSYFLNKHKQHLRAELAQKLSPLQKERDALAKEIDALDAKEEKINEEYAFQIKITKSMAKKKAYQVMKEVGIPQPEKRFNQYPFQFSGGMRQRIVIAIALIAEPNILICDEPTTALDVTIQAQILELINRLKAKHEMSVIFITHDLGVVANMADRVAVMYAGKIVEYGTDKEIFFDPRHPYTWALLSSIPDIDSKEKLEAIPGTPPDMIYPPVGDAFAARNKYALGVDFKHQPPYFEISPTHFVASWLEHPSAPEVNPPRIVSERIYNALNEEANSNE